MSVDEEKDELKGQVACPTCGAKVEVVDEAIVCSTCDKDQVIQVEVVPEPETESAVCPICGLQLKVVNDEIICLKCDPDVEMAALRQKAMTDPEAAIPNLCKECENRVGETGKNCAEQNNYLWAAVENCSKTLTLKLDPRKLRVYVEFHEHFETDPSAHDLDLDNMPEGATIMPPETHIFCGRCRGRGQVCRGCSGLTEKEGFGPCDTDVTCPDCQGKGHITHEQFEKFDQHHLRIHYNKESIMEGFIPFEEQRATPGFPNTWRVVVQNIELGGIYHEQPFETEPEAEAYLGGIKWITETTDAFAFHILKPNEKMCDQCCAMLKEEERNWDICIECTHQLSAQIGGPELDEPKFEVPNKTSPSPTKEDPSFTPPPPTPPEGFDPPTGDALWPE
jgi:hypothetical protein